MFISSSAKLKPDIVSDLEELHLLVQVLQNIFGGKTSVTPRINKLSQYSMPLPLGVKGLIFDCDGTLLDTMPLHWSAWCAICDETGLKFDKESFYALAGVPGREIIRELANEQGITLDPIEVYARKRAFFLKGLRSVQVIPCVVRFALEAHRRGISTAVASGSSRSQVEQG